MLIAFSPRRSPIVVFLSDGECSVEDNVTRDLSRRAIALGYVLSLGGPSSLADHNPVQAGSVFPCSVVRSAE